MAAQAGRIVAGSDTLGGGGIEYDLYPASQPRRGFWFLRPNRTQHPQHIIRGNVPHRHVPEDRVGIRIQCAAPLCPMLRVPPAFLVRRHIPLGHRPEGIHLRARFGELRRFLRRRPGVDRINPVRKLTPCVRCKLARLGKPDELERSKPHLAGPALKHEPEQPRLAPAGRHLKVKAAAVTEADRAATLAGIVPRRFHSDDRQSAHIEIRSPQPNSPYSTPKPTPNHIAVSPEHARTLVNKRPVNYCQNTRKCAMKRSTEHTREHKFDGRPLRQPLHHPSGSLMPPGCAAVTLLLCLRKMALTGHTTVRHSRMCVILTRQASFVASIPNRPC